MIQLDKLKPNMIFMFLSGYTSKRFQPFTMIVRKITADGPIIDNYDNNYSYGVLTLYACFHKHNTPVEQMKKDLIRDGELTS